MSSDEEDNNSVVEVIDLCQRRSKEFELAGENVCTVSVTRQASTTVTDLIKLLSEENIPEEVVWNSILTGFQSCTDFHQLKIMIDELNPYIPPMKQKVLAEFCPETDSIDRVAQSEIPVDGPVHLKAVKTDGDGNCLPRSLGKGYFNDDSKHPEIRARIVMEGISKMQRYLNPDCLERGATFLHKNA